MILRPLEPPVVTGDQLLDAWPVIENIERERYQQCWMITQPSHAALSGEIAARLTANGVPEIDAATVRAIALHDAGWGPIDAQMIVRSRARPPETPGSFLQTALNDFLAAWVLSIEIAQKDNDAGGYIVSRHFWRLAENRLAHGNDKPAERNKLENFLTSEAARQKKLNAKDSRTADELERLTDLLQLCDVISLYICAGVQQKARLPECFGTAATIEGRGETYHVTPTLVEPGAELSIAALRYPATKQESSREFLVTIE
jgi:hypothetical protein